MACTDGAAVYCVFMGGGLVITSAFMCVTGSHERGDGDDVVMGE